jgi:hypothetical protein
MTEPGEWIDKEPRADGKPRRWRPFEFEEGLIIDPSRLIWQPQDTDDTKKTLDKMD